MYQLSSQCSLSISLQHQHIMTWIHELKIMQMLDHISWTKPHHVEIVQASWFWLEKVTGIKWCWLLLFVCCLFRTQNFIIVKYMMVSLGVIHSAVNEIICACYTDSMCVLSGVIKTNKKVIVSLTMKNDVWIKSTNGKIYIKRLMKK